LAAPSKEARERAELKFKKKEVEAREATKAMADYKAGLIALQYRHLALGGG